MEEVLYLPITTPMPDSEWQRLLNLVRQAAPSPENSPL
jgi:hypothetical protein